MAAILRSRFLPVFGIYFPFEKWDKIPMWDLSVAFGSDLTAFFRSF